MFGTGNPVCARIRVVYDWHSFAPVTPHARLANQVDDFGAFHGSDQRPHRGVFPFLSGVHRPH